MLHILWMIIKFILIVLGILLGLILLAVLLLLFCPIRYRAVVTKEENGLKAVQADAKVSWLFGLIGFHAAYIEGKPKMSFRIFGISFEKIKGLFQKKKKDSATSGSGKKKKGKNSKKAQKEAAKKHSAKQDHKKAPKNEADNDGTGNDRIAAADRDSGGNAGRIGSTNSGRNAGKNDFEGTAEFRKEDSPEDETSSPGLFSRILGKLKMILGIPVRLVKFLVKLPGKITAALRKLWVTIQKICGKINWWKDFLEDERTKATIALVKERLGILLRHILPTKVTGNVTFGCEDPSTTGKILGVLGITYPLHKNRVAVTPLFDGENHLTGKVFLKGRIYGIVIVIAAVKIYFNKNTKYVIQRWKTRDSAGA